MLPLTMFLVAGALLASDPMLGTWKINVAKSKFNPGPAPQSITTTSIEDAGWVVAKTNGVNAEGNPINVENRFKTDGNEYPTQTAWGKGNMVIKKTDPYHWTSVVTLEGGNKITSKVVTPKDGKTRTHTSTGTNMKGEKINTVTVWERQ
jgi:hypothetical protein